MTASQGKLLCGLIGAGVGQSLTPAMQEEEARHQHLRLHYQLIDGFRRTMPDADIARVVLLGAGGAGSAIADAACRLGVGELCIVDTEPARAERLATTLTPVSASASARSGI